MKIKNLSQLAKFLDSKIKESKNILIVSHTNPDPDCLFSQLSLYYILKYRYPNKNFILFNKDYNYQKDNLKIINNDLRLIVNSLSCRKDDIDLIIGIEITNEERFGLIKDLIDYNKIIIIDHHNSFSLKSCYYYLEANSESCSIIIFKLANYFNFKKDLKFKINILSGIIGDTVGFRYIINRKTFLILSQIFDEKIKVFFLIKQIFGFNFFELKKITKLIDQIKIYKKKKLLVIFLSKNNKFKKINSFLEYLRLIKEIEVIVLLKEKRGKIYGSLRSERVDVSQIAQKFNGGGHKNSAGFVSNLPVKKIINFILKEI
ncbi:MAG: phosphoesterase RecJ domain-containing protein [Candidatus Parcubacteria bacterium]|nr:MAG: phosphoesterase RecJ domain-containing protein [Candidatus Parcubacteria bacterium]